MNTAKPKPRLLLALALTGAWAGGSVANGEDAERIRFEVLATPDVRVAGTSTLHDWECVGDRLGLNVQLDLTIEEFLNAVELAWRGEIGFPVEFANEEGIDGSPLLAEIPIEALQCDRSRMQRDLRRTIRFDEFPVIEYELKAIVEATVAQRSATVLRLKVKGDLMVAGVTREVEHVVEIVRQDDDSFAVSGELDLKMDWFDMEPPTALFGLLRAHNDFQVKFQFAAAMVKR